MSVQNNNAFSQAGRTSNATQKQNGTSNQPNALNNNANTKPQASHKQLEEMFRIPKSKKNQFPAYLDEERDDFFVGCTFEDGLEDIGNRELSHLEWMSVAPPPGKYRPKWDQILKDPQMLVDYQHQSKNRFKISGPKYKPFKHECSRVDTHGESHEHIYENDEESNMQSSRQNEFANITDDERFLGKTFRSTTRSDMYLHRTTDVFPYKPRMTQRGLVELERQLPRDRHDYVEQQKNKPNENRFNMPPERTAIDKVLSKNISMSKMIDREQVALKKKTGNLDYHSNFILVKPKNTYGPEFSHFMQTNREPKSMTSLKGTGRFKYNDFFNTSRKANVLTATNYKKMLGRGEVLGGNSKGCPKNPNLNNQTFRQKLEKIHPEYFRREAHHKLDIEYIMQDNQSTIERSNGQLYQDQS